MTEPHPILDLPMDPQTNAAHASSVREYLKELLLLLVEYGEDCIKRPFGNSGWEYELYAPLLKAGLIEGAFDEDGYIETMNQREGQALIVQAVKSL